MGKNRNKQKQKAREQKKLAEAAATNPEPKEAQDPVELPPEEVIEEDKTPDELTQQIKDPEARIDNDPGEQLRIKQDPPKEESKTEPKEVAKTEPKAEAKTEPKEEPKIEKQELPVPEPIKDSQQSSAQKERKSEKVLAETGLSSDSVAELKRKSLMFKIEKKLEGAFKTPQKKEASLYSGEEKQPSMQEVEHATDTAKGYVKEVLSRSREKSQKNLLEALEASKSKGRATSPAHIEENPEESPEASPVASGPHIVPTLDTSELKHPPVPAPSPAKPADQELPLPTDQEELPQPAPFQEGEEEKSGLTPIQLLAMSLARVKATADKHHANRKLDPGKFRNVKSKVGRNIKVVNKTNTQKKASAEKTGGLSQVNEPMNQTTQNLKTAPLASPASHHQRNPSGQQKTAPPKTVESKVKQMLKVQLSKQMQAARNNKSPSPTRSRNVRQAPTQKTASSMASKVKASSSPPKLQDGSKSAAPKKKLANYMSLTMSRMNHIESSAQSSSRQSGLTQTKSITRLSSPSLRKLSKTKAMRTKKPQPQQLERQETTPSLIGDVHPGEDSLNIKVDMYEYEPDEDIKQQAEEVKFQRRLSAAIQEQFTKPKSSSKKQAGKSPTKALPKSPSKKEGGPSPLQAKIKQEIELRLEKEREAIRKSIKANGLKAVTKQLEKKGKPNSTPKMQEEEDGSQTPTMAGPKQTDLFSSSFDPSPSAPPEQMVAPVAQSMPEPLNLKVSSEAIKKTKKKKKQMTQEQRDKKQSEMKEKQQNLKQENSVIQNQFQVLLEELEEKRSRKNPSFYKSILDQDYGSLPSNQKQEPGFQRSVTKKLVSAQQERMQARRDYSPDLEEEALKPRYSVNVKLAEKNPLAFIDSVLKHHGQPV